MSAMQFSLFPGMTPDRPCENCGRLAGLRGVRIDNTHAEMCPDCRDLLADAKQAFGRAKQRAAERDEPFRLTQSDVFKLFDPSRRCPVLGLELRRSKGCVASDNSPSLDRIRNERGYVPGNVALMSLRANRLKNDGTSEEFRKIAAWMAKAERARPGRGSTKWAPR